MLPICFVEETTVRESGESAVFDASEHSQKNLLLTLTITHAIENESIDVDIQASLDGVQWPTKPIVGFAPKSYCGTYHLILPPREARYLKAVWRVLRWSRTDRPFFRFYILAQSARDRVVAAGAA